jgi:hypothetical protein
MSRKENIKKYYSLKNEKEKNIKYAKSLRKNSYLDLENHIWNNMISRINNGFISQNATRSYKYEELIGCKKDELLDYLKSINSSGIDIAPSHFVAFAPLTI